MSAIPEYDYYIMIEYDVHLVRRNPFFIEGLINRLAVDGAPSYDFVSQKVGKCSPGDKFAVPALRHYDTAYYGGLFAFVIFSRRALDFLFKERLKEGADEKSEGQLTHCEVFALTALMNSTIYNCGGLNDLCPGCVNEKYHGASPNFAVPNYLLGTTFTDLDPRTELIHPVLDAEEYCGRLLRHARNAGPDVFEDVIRHIEKLDRRLVDPEVFSYFLNQASALSRIKIS